jgi:hypothetical protein
MYKQIAKIAGIAVIMTILSVILDQSNYFNVVFLQVAFYGWIIFVIWNSVKTAMVYKSFVPLTIPCVIVCIFCYSEFVAKPSIANRAGSDLDQAESQFLIRHLKVVNSDGFRPKPSDKGNE